MLVEIDPAVVVDGVRSESGFLAYDVKVNGIMRETCPECKTSRLKLVLRQTRVKRAHLFCEECTRCFDARYEDGSCALSIV